ncbi:GNAT family acetyltransferase [Cryobacterium sp. PAMC25264]|uniref:GNAT family acetyltransferase n=1 Tax=Cryobacterium sp. PAMC25264 TaxID=2861288 RepID=UPI001C62F930|nr:GNAT family acetyltransferase [Cryobacterium sp. PAMC25264]QYF74183.1 GNAT family acetyltransferase [Cryobacterium sp. PAMC25264]
MQIAAITTADFESVIALWESTGLTRPWNPPAADLERALGTESATVLGVFADAENANTDITAPERQGNTLLGTVMVGHDGHRGWIYYLAVAPSEQGTGLGRMLMGAAEAWLVDHGAVKVQLMVRQTNVAVTGFYDRLGYADADVRVLAKRLD